jgi:hypothetical protein
MQRFLVEKLSATQVETAFPPGTPGDWWESVGLWADDKFANGYDLLHWVYDGGIIWMTFKVVAK